ncbi:hypothetical protein YC2023_017760 [Brassica napus]
MGYFMRLDCFFDYSSLECLILLAGIIFLSLAKVQYLEMLNFINLKNMTRPFPHFISPLSNLKCFSLDGLRLSGPRLANTCTLTNIQTISVKGNQFTGSLPDSVSILPHLNYLEHGNNF